jgi:RNA polymerase sigma factor (sigma-70 family)
MDARGRQRARAATVAWPRTRPSVKALVENAPFSAWAAPAVRAAPTPDSVIRRLTALLGGERASILSLDLSKLEAAVKGLALVLDEDPERSPDALLERWRVAHMLSKLRAEEAELLRLRFYEGLTQTEIAERTGIALGTVKMRMVAALERLRGLIDAEESA